MQISQPGFYTCMYKSNKTTNKALFIFKHYFIMPVQIMALLTETARHVNLFVDYLQNKVENCCIQSHPQNHPSSRHSHRVPGSTHSDTHHPYSTISQQVNRGGVIFHVCACEIGKKMTSPLRKISPLHLMPCTNHAISDIFSLNLTKISKLA